MEARSILLTSLVFALWTSTTTGQDDFCLGKPDGPYCEHCWQPVDCKTDVSTPYALCPAGQACTVNFGAAFCVSHTETECACTGGAGDQCDAYNPGFIEHCDASGLFLVEACPPETPTCSNGVCVIAPVCEPSEWSLTSDCTGAIFCDANSVITGVVDCQDGEYVNSDYECATAPVPACDGSCTGRCPNPIDCLMYFICDGTTVISSGPCPPDTNFDINTNTCIAGGLCPFLDGCSNLEVGLGEITTPGDGITTKSVGITTTSDGITSTTSDGITTTSEGITTTTAGITTTSAGDTTTSDGDTTTSDGDTTTSDGTPTTTDGGEYTVPPPETCNSLTVGSKYPVEACSKQYYVCKELAAGQYGYITASCLGDYVFDTDPANPYCTLPDNIDTCQ